MRVLLFGTTGMTLRAADAVSTAESVSLVGVVTAPEAFTISYAPEGFRNSQFAHVQEWANHHGVPAHVRGEGQELASFVAAREAEFGLVVGWHHNLPASVIRAFPKGVAGVHASLLPDLRGHAPLPWAILTGRMRTGVSLFAIEESGGVDEGPIYAQVDFEVGERATIAELLRSAEQATEQALVASLPAIAAGDLRPTPQHGVPTYGLRRAPSDGQINWLDSSDQVDRLVRAVTRPYPGAWTMLGDEEWYIWATRPGSAPTVHGAPGQIALLAGVDNPVVVTGDGWIEVLELTAADGSDLMPVMRRRNHHRLAAR